MNRPPVKSSPRCTRRCATTNPNSPSATPSSHSVMRRSSTCKSRCGCCLRGALRRRRRRFPTGNWDCSTRLRPPRPKTPRVRLATEVGTHRRGTPKRAPIPQSLPRIDIKHRLPEDERTCPHHGVELERFGEVVSEQLDIIPMQVRVLRHVRGKYRCPCCEGHLRTAPMPAQPVPKSFASPGLLACIATAKYADALPLYRQCQQLQRIGVELSARRWRRGWCAWASSWCRSSTCCATSL